jgi:hypothetical protein
VSFDVSENPQPVQQGDFKEYIFDTKFKLTWAQYVDLLVELHKSTEFLKPIRMTVASQYEKEDRLDVDLEVSTIEYSPAPVKAVPNDRRCPPDAWRCCSMQGKPPGGSPSKPAAPPPPAQEVAVR